MNVLLLTHYPRAGASSRVRFYQYLEYLKRHGLEVAVAPLFGDRYLSMRPHRCRPPLGELLRRYAVRMRWLTQVRGFDLLWIEGELFPGLPAWTESLVRRLGVPYVVDYDDAVFHRYDQSPVPGVRCLLGRKVDRVMRGAALVVVGNAYLAERARRAGARAVVQVPSVVDLDRYAIAAPAEARPVTIGWIGSWSTAKYLRGVAEALTELSRDPNTRVIAVGADPARVAGLPIEARSWSETTEVSEIQGFDIGIMPLDDGPWERGKCGYKLIQYMACGKPVVASPVGANRDIILHGINGFHASTTDDWMWALRELRSRPGLRARMGAEGRRVTEQRYSLSAMAPLMHEVLCSAARRRAFVQGRPELRCTGPQEDQ
jgi:glycosyltransferase involved in cell wall biosynthesis